jgi:hypothetical protein
MKEGFRGRGERLSTEERAGRTVSISIQIQMKEFEVRAQVGRRVNLILLLKKKLPF